MFDIIWLIKFRPNSRCVIVFNKLVFITTIKYVMLNLNLFVLLCLELNSRRVDPAETNTCYRLACSSGTVTMPTINHGL